jgi:chromatin remodeling complex protein RSC6|tara:strand:+ start:564 stop:1058 length:495 start_codon:yes stop_codon:yes gene_type:complete
MSNPTNTVVAPEESKTPQNEVCEQFGGILSTLSSFRSQITMLQNQVRGLEKTVGKQMRAFQREAKKNKNKGNRKPSGFAVPTPISKELCDFMGKEYGSKAARTEVTQYIIQYIKDNKLQWNENRKIIKPNTPLKNLLATKKNDEVTYFNIQRYMNRHFIKNESS